MAVAHRLLADCGGLGGFTRLDRRELAQRPGLGPAKIASLLAAIELGKRFAKAELQTAERLDQPQIAGEFLEKLLVRGGMLALRSRPEDRHYSSNGLLVLRTDSRSFPVASR